jgi:hypothetical protein
VNADRLSFLGWLEYRIAQEASMDAEIVCGTAMPLDVSEMEYAAAGLYAPGEVMGLDHGGRVVAWGGAARGP